MNDELQNSFFSFSVVTENDDYGKLLAKLLNKENACLSELKVSFKPFRYGENYKGVLITFYLGDFNFIPSIDKPYLSNYSKKDKEWNYKLPIKEANISILTETEKFNDFIKLSLVNLEKILQNRKIKDFDFKTFREDIERLP